MYDLDKIKERFKSVPNKPYKFGYEFTKDMNNFEGIAFGIGYGSFKLYQIYIQPNKIEYSICYTKFPDLKYEVDYKDDFYIPRSASEFQEFFDKIV